MPNGNWRSLVAGSMATDIERERKTGLNVVLKRAFANVEARQAEQRKGVQRGQEIAQTALYQKKPEMAAAHLGMEYPETETGVPTGLEPTKYKDPDTGVEYGQPGGEITRKDLGRWYTDYTAKVREINTQFSLFKGRKGFEGYKDIPIPTFKDWMSENFPEFGRGAEIDTGKMDDKELNEYLVSEGFEAIAENRRILKRNLEQQQQQAD